MAKDKGQRPVHNIVQVAIQYNNNNNNNHPHHTVLVFRFAVTESRREATAKRNTKTVW